jgi:hypothetical protein
LYEEREHPSIIRNMNRISFRAIITTIAAVSLFAACEKYDDSALVARMDKAEADIKELQTLLNQLNSTLSGLATTVDALKAQDRIVSVTELADKSGWVVEFSQTGKITIYNGKNGIDGKDGKDGTNGTDGTNGQDGITPTIGVKLDADGNYYWTVNGEYLLDENGNKIAATAHVATPQLRINNGNFEISYNGGVTWEIIGEAGNTGAVIFSKVEDGTDAVTFTLGDGTTIVIPKAGAFSIVMDTDVIITAGESVNVTYSINSSDDATVVDAFGTKGFEAEVMASSVSAGMVRITAPNPLTNGKVYVIAVKGDGTTAARILTCEEGVFTLDETAFAVKVPAAGGAFEVPFQTNLDNPMVMVSPGYSWITYVETKAVRNGRIVFNIEENTTDEERTGQVSINFKPYTIVQEGKGTSTLGGGQADLETINGGDVSNFSNNMTIPYSTTDGWVAMGARVLNLTSKFSDITTLRPVLGARTSVNGTLTSPVLSGGCGKVTIDYARITTKTGSNFTIDIKSSDGSTVLKSENHVDETMTQYGREQLDFDINVTGDFIIVVTGNKCSNTGTSNDDFAILGLSWTGYSE